MKGSDTVTADLRARTVLSSHPSPASWPYSKGACEASQGAKLHSPLATESSALRNDLDPAINAHIDRALAGAVANADEVEALKARIAPGGGVMASINKSGQSDAAPLTEEVAAAAKAGAMGAIFYNYGLLREEELGFIGEALAHVRAGG